MTTIRNVIPLQQQVKLLNTAQQNPDVGKLHDFFAGYALLR
jgi:hypothetical protein